MNEFPAKVFGNGRITIPKEIREICHIEDGDIVTLSVLEVAHIGKVKVKNASIRR